MEENNTKKPVKKRTTAKKPAAASPFADTVETKKVAKPRAIRIVKAEIPEPKPATTPATRTKKPVALTVDPFAEIAIATSTTARKRQDQQPKGVEKEAVATAARTPKKTKSAPRKATAKKPTLDVTAEIAALEPAVELSPAFKALADVSLPPLEKENRARLLMQSPSSAYLYWSLRDNPWQQLRKVFGESLGSYTLVIKLNDLTNDTDSYYPADADGEKWFDVEPGTEYSAEIGFYAPNRPYFRVLHSNTIETPRRSPSPHPASDARWTVSATKFAEVLDVSGFTRDAFDVAMAGDDVFAAADASNLAFSSFVGGGDFSHFAPEDVRYALLSIAAGVGMHDLRGRVSRRLFETLQTSSIEISPERSRAALKEYFDIDDAEWTEEQFGPAVYGSSLVHFPKTLKTRKVVSSYKPLSSHSVLS